MTSIFKGQPSKTRPFPIKTMVIWVLGIYIYTLEVNHHFKNGGSFWMMINPY